MTGVGCINIMKVAVCLSLVVSCSKVRYSAPVVNDEVPLVFTMDWSDVIPDGETPPQNTKVMMTKVKSVVRHFVWDVDKDGNVMTDKVTDSGEPAVETVTSGSYVVSGFCSYEDEHGLISDVEAFGSHEDLRMQNVTVSIPELTQEELEQLGVKDYNPVSPYIRTIPPCYYVTGNGNGLWNVPSEGGVKLKFKHLTCRLNFSFQVGIEDGVQLERIAGVVSGLPVRAYVMSGHVEAEDTGKMLFPLEICDGTSVSEDRDGIRMTNAKYAGCVDSFGILPPVDKLQRTGNGILNILVMAKVVEPGVDGKADKEYNRVFNAAFNMKDMIENADLMTKIGSDSQRYELNASSCDFTISNTINVTKEMVKSDMEGGFDEWDKEDCSGDEGLNQEI